MHYLVIILIVVIILYVINKTYSSVNQSGGADKESESEEDVLKALTSKGLDEFIFTALYQIDMQIDIRNLTGKVPYEPIFYLDDEYNPEKG